MCVVHINAYLVAWIAIQFVVLGTQLICMVLLYTWSACFPMKLNAMHTWCTRATLINLITVWLVLIRLQPQHSKEMLMHTCTLQLSFIKGLHPWECQQALPFLQLRDGMAMLPHQLCPVALSHCKPPRGLFSPQPSHWTSELFSWTGSQQRQDPCLNPNCSDFQSTGACIRTQYVHAWSMCSNYEACTIYGWLFKGLYMLL